ncbi:hypothetical protein L917_19757 [Phytophthora nicotianae]|uniref:Uncharacterized protein n=1 Tax=Phytophthora nicotianae TaxID=4792 RepID=W2K541_PHYNI|nr:hypothetical protein L917_19757 [Phytophthora nicotianae]
MSTNSPSMPLTLGSLDVLATTCKWFLSSIDKEYLQ